MRTTFLVGRLTPKSTEIVVVNEAQPAPIRGPWTLRALVRSQRQREISPPGASHRIH